METGVLMEVAAIADGEDAGVVLGIDGDLGRAGADDGEGILDQRQCAIDQGDGAGEAGGELDGIRAGMICGVQEGVAEAAGVIGGIEGVSEIGDEEDGGGNAGLEDLGGSEGSGSWGS